MKKFRLLLFCLSLGLLNLPQLAYAKTSSYTNNQYGFRVYYDSEKFKQKYKHVPPLPDHGFTLVHKKKHNNTRMIFVAYFDEILTDDSEKLKFLLPDEKLQPEQPVLYKIDIKGHKSDALLLEKDKIIRMEIMTQRVILDEMTITFFSSLYTDPAHFVEDLRDFMNILSKIKLFKPNH